MDKIKVKKIILNLINVPNHKLEYLICVPSLIQGLKDSFKHYGIEYNKEVHNLLVEEVQSKLEGSYDIEREWTEQEYTTFVLFSNL